jgi:hypothetical protein
VNGGSRGLASPLLQKQMVPIETVLSIVYPMSDPSSASAYIAAADSQRGLRCIQREESRKTAGLGGRAGRSIEVVALRSPLSGAPVSGVRVWKCLSGSQPCKSRRSRSFTDRLWFATGRDIVMLAYIAGARNEAKTQAPVVPLSVVLVMDHDAGTARMLRSQQEGRHGALVSHEADSLLDKPLPRPFAADDEFRRWRHREPQQPAQAPAQIAGVHRRSPPILADSSAMSRRLFRATRLRPRRRACAGHDVPRTPRNS